MSEKSSNEDKEKTLQEQLRRKDVGIGDFSERSHNNGISDTLSPPPNPHGVGNKGDSDKK